MSNHQIHHGTPTNLLAVNGHTPTSTWNPSTSTATVGCDTCPWVGRSYGGRWAHKADEQWRVHAGDIAMRVEIVHGQPNSSCHCRKCKAVNSAGR